MISSTSSSHLLTVAVVLGDQLPERGRVEVQHRHRDPHLVRPDLGGGVQPWPLCGRTPAGLDDAVQADRGRRSGSSHPAILSARTARSPPPPGRTTTTTWQHRPIVGDRMRSVIDSAGRSPYPRGNALPAEGESVSHPLPQPYDYRQHEVREPDWTRSARLERRHHRRVGERPVAALALRQEHQAAARGHGRPAQRRLLRRPRARPG